MTITKVEKVTAIGNGFVFVKGKILRAAEVDWLREQVEKLAKGTAI